MPQADSTKQGSLNAPRVLLVGDYPPPQGGVAVHVELLHRRIRAAGGECSVLDIGKGQLPADGVVPAGGMLPFAARVSAAALRGDCIHLHTSGANPKSWLLAAACAAAASASPHRPIITFHSGLFPAWLAHSAARRALAGAVVRQYGRAVAVSEEIRATLLTCGVPADRILVAAAFSPAFLVPGAAPAGLSDARGAGGPVFAAMLAPPELYGAETLLRAFVDVRAELPRAQLVLYGPGTSESSLRRRLLELGLPPGCVHGLGELHRPAALAVLAGCDVFVRPTWADGDSVSVREALALGRRVVATSVGHRPPGVDLVPPRDVAALGRALAEAGRGAGDRRAAEALAATERTPPGPAPEDGLDPVLALYGLGPAAPAAEVVTTPSTRTETEPGESRCAASVAS